LLQDRAVQPLRSLYAAERCRWRHPTRTARGSTHAAESVLSPYETNCHNRLDRMDDCSTRGNRRHACRRCPHV